MGERKQMGETQALRTPKTLSDKVTWLNRRWTMEGIVSDADTARRNGWQVGTRLIGDEGYGETIIEITAIGESKVLAKTISHDGKPRDHGESIWTFSCRDWRVVTDGACHA